jgi:16S rRNA G527 N7-methylase RsmG
MIQESSPINLSSADLFGKYDPDQKLEPFFDLLMEENKRVNLVSRETKRDDLRRLSAESLAPLELIGEKRCRFYLDIGSGGGFPSIPIMTAAASGVIEVEQVRLIERTQKRAVEQVRLIERTQKRAAALGRITSGLNLQAEIVPEDFPGKDTSTKFDLVTLRYVKLTPKLLTAIFESLHRSGLFIYYSQPEFAHDRHRFSAVTQLFTLDLKEPPRPVTFFRNLS